MAAVTFTNASGVVVGTFGPKMLRDEVSGAIWGLDSGTVNAVGGVNHEEYEELV
jgi:hypothetical protein